MKVEFITHACLKLSDSFGTLCCDPWLLNEPVFNLSTWKFPPNPARPEVTVRDVDYLLITHTHEDHFHIPSLHYFSRDTPIFLSAFDRHPSLRAHTLEITLRKLGFHQIRRLNDWETVQLDEHCELTMIPSSFSRSQDWENAGFVLRTPDCTLLNLNDNINDEALCNEIKSRFDHIDICFIQTGGVTMYPGCFKMSEETMREEAHKRKIAFADQRRMLEFIQPACIAPFAGDFCWLAPQYKHQNWANRTTPLLMQSMIEEDFSWLNVDMVLMQPGDQWSKDSGLVERYPRIQWNDYLKAIDRLSETFKEKIQRIDRWLRESPMDNLEERSRCHTEKVMRHITHDYIDFTARFRMVIEGSTHSFSFVTKANPLDGFCIDWNDSDPVEQTLYIPEHIWAAIMDGRLMWNIIQWVAVAEQTTFTRDMGRFWFWMEYHIDLNSKNIQALICDHLWPHVTNRIRPTYGAFPIANQHEAVHAWYAQLHAEHETPATDDA